MTPSMIPQDLSALNIFEPSLLISVLPLAYDYFLSVVTPFFFFQLQSYNNVYIHMKYFSNS